MIMYTYICDTEVVTRYEHVPGRGFRATARRPLASLRPEVAATLRAKARLCGGHASVYLDDKGNIIDTPGVLP